MLSIHWDFFNGFNPLRNDFDAFDPFGDALDPQGMLLAC